MFHSMAVFVSFYNDRLPLRCLCGEYEPTQYKYFIKPRFHAFTLKYYKFRIHDTE